MSAVSPSPSGTLPLHRPLNMVRQAFWCRGYLGKSFEPKFSVNDDFELSISLIQRGRRLQQHMHGAKWFTPKMVYTLYAPLFASNAYTNSIEVDGN